MRVRGSVINTVFLGHVRSWYRNRTTLFWTLAFPVLLMLLFGGIFSIEQGKLDLFVRNDDQMRGKPTEESLQLLGILNATDAFNIQTTQDRDILTDQGQFRERGIARLLIIPEGFGSDLRENNASIVLVFDQSQSSSAVTLGIVSGVIGEMNLMVANSQTAITLRPEQALSTELRFVDFFLPGVIGLSILQTATFGTIGTNTKYWKNGVLRKLATTPLSKLEWVMGMVIFQALLAVISAVVITVVGVVVFNIRIIPNLLTVFLLLAGALAFPGLGMVIARLVREEEAADAAGNAIIFPMMFLSGTFFPLELMPPILQIVARALPLTYLNNGLRDAMILGNPTGALFNGLIMLVIGFIFILIGARVTQLRPE